MSDVDDAIRSELARLVRPVDSDAVMAALDASRVAKKPHASRSWLVAAAILAVFGLAGLALVSSRPDEPSVTAGAGEADVPRLLPAAVPAGAELVSVHQFASEEWPTPPEKPWATPGRYTLSYRDRTDPLGGPFFDLEVFPGVDLDLDAALATLGEDPSLVSINGNDGVRVGDPDAQPTSERVIWQMAPGLVARIDANGLDAEEVHDVAESVRTVSEAEWEVALAGADVAPPYGFRGATVQLQGEGWTITAGVYRQTFGLPSGCVLVELADPDRSDPQAGGPVCLNPYPLSEADREAASLDLHHVWVDDRLLVWGLPPAGVQRIRLVYDEGTFEVALDDRDGPLRTARIPGTDSFVFAGELTVGRRPSRIEMLDPAGEIISASQDLTPRDLPPRQDGEEPRPPSSVLAVPEPVAVLETEIMGRPAMLEVRQDKAVGPCLDLTVEGAADGPALSSGACDALEGLSWHLTPPDVVYGNAPAGTAYLEIQARRRAPSRVEVSAHPAFPDVVFFVAALESVADDELVAFDEDGRELGRVGHARVQAVPGDATTGGA